MLSINKMEQLRKSLQLCNKSRRKIHNLLNQRRNYAVESAVPYDNTLKNDKTTSPKNEVPEEADVVVIGGGSIGCNTVYHLTKLGVTNVVLLEKDRITSGTTWHTAGLVWRLRPSDVEIEIQAHTRNLVRDVLEAETGVSSGWVENGGLFIASTKARLQEYERLHSLGKVYGIESFVLSPDETQKLYPLINKSDLYGSLYSPGDGTLDPSGFCTALTRAATAAGAKMIENCPVTGINVHEDDFGTKRVTSVETPTGTIKTRRVVNCTGVWAPMIGAFVGINVPLMAFKHAYVVTNRIEGIQNMPNIRDHDLSIYLKLQGDSLSIGGYEPNPIPWKKVQKDFAFSLFDLDWDVFGVHLTGAMTRVPVLDKVGIKSTVCGPESFTADHKPIMGEDPFVRGFFHGCGFNSGGMMLGGGCGRELAKWVVNGRPDLDMYGYDIRRFNPELTGNRKWIQERSHESYSRHYTIAYQHDEVLAGRNVITDPFHQDLLNAGCVFQQRLGWERPGWFSPEGPAPVLKYDYYGQYNVPSNENYTYYQRLKDEYTFEFSKHHDVIGRECINCRTDVAVFNMSYFGKYYMVGPDAEKAADWIFTNNVNKPEGSVIYTCMLNKQGGIEADLTVSPVFPGKGGSCDPEFEGENGFYIAAGGGASWQNFFHIQSVIQDRGFNAHLIDRSKDMGMLSIQGPKSRELLQSITDADLSDKAFPFSTQKLVHVAGHEVRALRLSFVGELGWELHIPVASCLPIYRLLMEKGRHLGVVNAGYRAIDSLSIEKGYRHWHADLRIDDTPLEAGLGFTCKLKQPTPFLGREALERQRKEGLKKRLACFTIDEHVPLWGLEAIWRSGAAVGFVRRADYGFALGRSIGYGYVHAPEGGTVDAEFLKSGDYHIERMGHKIPAKLHLRSPFDPDNKRVKGVYDEPLPVARQASA